MKNKLAVRLKELRIKLGMTQEEVANMLNIKRSTYGEYERGKITPPIDKIEQLAEIMESTPQYIVGWEPQIIDGQSRSHILLLKYTSKWLQSFPDATFTDEEIDEVISYAKYVKSKNANMR